MRETAVASTLESPAPERDRLLQCLGYRFRDSSLLDQALTHKSIVNESPERNLADNERMELLGDAILDFAVTEMLMEHYTRLSEGELSKLRAGMVNETNLASIARRMGLGPCLRLGRGEELSGGRDKSSILSDAFEALVAAVYLDSKDTENIAAASRIVRDLLRDSLPEPGARPNAGDYKTELQELVQRRLKERVTYRVLSEQGPDHDKQYEVAVFVKDREYGRGRGRSKKESEQAAAREALSALAGGSGSPS
jgi:ribonuclease-3